MSSASGPSIATRGLVLDFDMNNTQKSWKGKPTTNYVDPKWISWSVDGSGQATIGTRTIVSLYDCIITDTVSNTRQNIFVLGLSASTAYTFSVKFKKISGAPTLRFQLQSYNGATLLAGVFPTTVQIGLTDIDGWQTASYTYTTAVGADRVLWFMQDGNDYTTYTHSFELKEPQAELGSFATPFIAGTRSTTQAIVDLTNNNTLTATSLTYASDNTFSFDGSSNYLTATGSKFTGGMAAYTIMFWARRDVEGRMPVASLTGTSFYWYGDNSWKYVHGGAGGEYYYSKPTSIPLGTWGHYCVVYNGANVSIYRQGVFQGSQATTGTADWSMGMQIGNWQGGTGYQWSGKIDSVNFYNQALSAAEVAQNFNAIRSRYGL